ncbi:hypothetical protein AVEN_60069-1 [Araneus ventricosus]|uniref:ATP-dependent DNA helicase PIF1 n=1 Tax=Araneus ventricosus TaxID=182803 RepID=A0A4Y2QCZ5_ARAVE|nr:hypothetical protein AVEN_60069-1 [Araneus ventricosus]
MMKIKSKEKVKSLKKFFNETVLLTGSGTEESVLIPRISLTPTDLPFSFKRVKLLVRLCFGLTINKAQGETFHTAGIDVSGECFHHGQLYVAVSRVTSMQNVFVLALGGKADNVVYEEIL